MEHICLITRKGVQLSAKARYETHQTTSRYHMAAIMSPNTLLSHIITRSGLPSDPSVDKDQSEELASFTALIFFDTYFTHYHFHFGNGVLMIGMAIWNWH
jgi:hypothetical protein